MKRLTNEQSETFAQIGKKTDGDINFPDAPRILDWTSLTTESMEELAAAAVAPYMFPQMLALQSVDFAYLGWLSLTVALSMLTAFLVYRMWWPRRTM
jgi:hypothetical protein